MVAANISAAQIVGDTPYLDLVRQLRPAIARAVVRHGNGTTLAITANEAIDTGSGGRVAEASRNNAEMMDAHEAVRTVAGNA